MGNETKTAAQACQDLLAMRDNLLQAESDPEERTLAALLAQAASMQYVEIFDEEQIDLMCRAARRLDAGALASAIAACDKSLDIASAVAAVLAAEQQRRDAEDVH